ncbi:MAG: hypothetical protein R6W82_11440 [bacterium]
MKLNEAQLRAVFWSGLVTGLLSAFPLTALFNCFCCLWAWAAGAGAVHLARRGEPEGVHDPLPLGARAGAYAGLVSSLLKLLWAAAAGSMGRVDIERVRSYLPDEMPREAGRMVERMLESGVAGPAGLIFSAVLSIILFAIFGALGAVLYDRISGPRDRREQPPPPPGPGEEVRGGTAGAE